MQNEKGRVKDIIYDILNDIFKKLDVINKLTVERYEETLCDHIEGCIHNTEEKEEIKCFGGSCVITFASNSHQEKRILKNDNDSENSLGGYVCAEVILYFKDVNDKWINIKTVGRTDIKKFDMQDSGTEEFIYRIRAGEKIEHKISL